MGLAIDEAYGKMREQIKESLDSETKEVKEIADELKQFLNTDDIDMYLTKYRDAINMDDHLALSKTIEDLKIVQEELQEIGKNNKADIMDDNVQSALHRMGTLLTSFRKNFTESEKVLSEKIKNISNTFSKEGEKTYKETKARNEKIIEDTRIKAQSFFENMKQIADLKIFVNFFSGLGQAASGLNAI